jgi:hypothetical protein
MTRRALVASLILAAGCASPAAAPPPTVVPAFPAGGTASAGDLSGKPRIVVTPTAVLVDGSAVEDFRGFDRARYLDGLAARLKARSRAAEAFRSVTVEADRSAAIEAIASVLATAAGLRFTRVSLRAGGVSFDGDYWFPVVHPALCVVRASFDTLRNCYTRGLAQTASLHGRVAVQFVIGRDGHVGQTVLHDGTTMPDPVVSDCVLGVFRTLTFPKPDLGDAKVVSPSSSILLLDWGHHAHPLRSTCRTAPTPPQILEFRRQELELRARATTRCVPALWDPWGAVPGRRPSDPRRESGIAHRQRRECSRAGFCYGLAPNRTSTQ